MSFLGQIGVWIFETLLKDLVSWLRSAYAKYQLGKANQKIADDNVAALKDAEVKGDLDAIAKAGENLLNGKSTSSK